MATKRMNRRYAEIVKFLKSTLCNPHISHRVRMQAAERLTDIYERAAARQDALQRSQNAPGRNPDIQTPPANQQCQEEGIPPQELSVATAEAQAFLASIGKDQIKRENGTD